MKKEEFLSELERRLSGISEEERADAMAFYRSYLEDAGEENEEAVIAEFESPEKVAESILRDLGVEAQSEAEKEAEHETNCDNDSKYYNSVANRDAEYYNNVNQAVNNLNGNQQKKDNTGTVILLVIVAVLTSPIWLTVLIALASVLLGLVCALFGIAVAVVAVMASLISVGFVLGGIGIGTMFGGNPAAGIGLIGGGCIVLALGILALVLVVWVLGAFLPWVVRGVVNLCKKLFNKRKERMAS